MEVVLLENIKKLGKIGDVVRVKRGHGFTPLFTMKKGSFGAIGADIQSGKSLRATKIIPANKNPTIPTGRYSNPTLYQAIS